MTKEQIFALFGELLSGQYHLYRRLNDLAIAGEHLTTSSRAVPSRRAFTQDDVVYMTSFGKGDGRVALEHDSNPDFRFTQQIAKRGNMRQIRNLVNPSTGVSRNTGTPKGHPIGRSHSADFVIPCFAIQPQPGKSAAVVFARLNGPYFIHEAASLG